MYHQPGLAISELTCHCDAFLISQGLGLALAFVLADPGPWVSRGLVGLTSGLGSEFELGLGLSLWLGVGLCLVLGLGPWTHWFKYYG